MKGITCEWDASSREKLFHARGSKNAHISTISPVRWLRVMETGWNLFPDFSRELKDRRSNYRDAELPADLRRHFCIHSLAGKFNLGPRKAGKLNLCSHLQKISHSNGVKIMHKPLHVRSANEVQFEANMTFECAATRSLVADLLETIPKALNAISQLASESSINLVGCRSECGVTRSSHRHPHLNVLCSELTSHIKSIKSAAVTRP